MIDREPRTWPALAAITLAATIAYAPSFAVPFQFDDEARLSHNLAMQQGALFDALRWLGNSRVVPSLTLVLNYRLGGYEPLGYHVANFAVHLLTAFGVFALAIVLCRTPRLRGTWSPRHAVVLATAAGIVFACHPLQTQAVTYIIQRYASMAALFYVWATVCYVRARLRRAGLEAGSPAPYVVAVGFLALCAVLSKENAVSLPGAVLLAEWAGFGRPRRWRALATASVVCALGGITVLVVWKAIIWQPAVSGASVPLLDRLVYVFNDSHLSPLHDDRPGPLTYLWTQVTVIPRYLGLAIRPWGLNVDHDVPFTRTPTAGVAAGMAFLAGVAALGVWQLRTRPLVAFGILWVFVTLSIESSVFPIDDPMMEHRMYLPMVGLALIAGWAFAAVYARAPRAMFVTGTTLAAALVALTFARNLVWLSPLTLWRDAADKSPDKARVHINLGAAYHRADLLDEAVEEYCRALELTPDDQIAHDNLELALTSLGKFDHVEPKVVGRQPDGKLILEMEDAAAFCPHHGA